MVAMSLLHAGMSMKQDSNLITDSITSLVKAALTIPGESPLTIEMINT
jgi:hypothetical protein